MRKTAWKNNTTTQNAYYILTASMTCKNVAAQDIAHMGNNIGKSIDKIFTY